MNSDKSNSINFSSVFFKIFKPISVYAGSVFINALLSFITFSFLTKYLSEYDYGVINLYGALCIFLVPFISFGIQFTLNVDYFKLTTNEYSKHFSNGLRILIITGIFFTVLFAALFFFIEKLIKVNIFFTIIMPLSCGMIVLNEVMLGLIRNKGRHSVYLIFSISKSIVETGVTLLLVIGLAWGWPGRLSGALIAIILMTLFAVYLIRKWNLYNRDFNGTEVIKVARVGLPFIPERLAIFVLSYSDRFFIDHFEGTNDVGYYGAGAQIALIVNLSILVLINVFHPIIIRKLSAETIDYKGIRNSTIAFISGAAIVTMCVIICTPFIFRHFIGERFQQGQIYAVNLGIGYFMWAIYAVFLAYLLSAKKNTSIMIISIVGMIASLTLNYYNVNHYGAIGATYTSIIVYSLMALSIIFVTHKVYNITKFFKFSF